MNFTAASFMARIERIPGFECHIWTGSNRKAGYGFVMIKGKKIQAHRVAWQLHNGRPVPDGMLVLHKCDNPPCVNPHHLFLGTNLDNMRDCAAKNRKPLGMASAKARPLTFGGRTMTKKEWGESLGLSSHTITRRLELGWTVERAVTTPRILPAGTPGKRRPRTHCRRGHEYQRVSPDGRHKCVICESEQQRRRRALRGVSERSLLRGV